MVDNAVLQVLLRPGNLGRDVLGAREDDDRSMIRPLVNMLFESLSVVFFLVMVW